MTLNELALLAKERNAMVLIVPTDTGVDLIIRDPGSYQSNQVTHRIAYPPNPSLTKDALSTLLACSVKRLFRDLEAKRADLV